MIHRSIASQIHRPPFTSPPIMATSKEWTPFLTPRSPPSPEIFRSPRSETCCRCLNKTLLTSCGPVCPFCKHDFCQNCVIDTVEEYASKCKSSVAFMSPLVRVLVRQNWALLTQESTEQCLMARMSSSIPRDQVTTVNGCWYMKANVGGNSMRRRPYRRDVLDSREGIFRRLR